MNNQKSKKLILIDWYKTLSVTVFWHDLKISDPDTYHKVEALIFAKKLDIAGSWMRGRLTAERVCEIISSELDLNYPKLLEILIKSCCEMKIIEPKVLDSVKELIAKGNIVYIFTDNMDTFNRWTVPSLKLKDYFSGIVNSYDVGALKKELLPDGKSSFLNYLDINTEDFEVFLFDDNLETSKIYSKLGVKTYLVTEDNTLEKLLNKLN